MARELDQLSDIHCAQTLLDNKDSTLAFDATTQGVHVNVITVSTPSQSLVMAVDQLAGGTSEDYFTHIIETIDNIADSYSEVNGSDLLETKSKIIENVHCISNL